MKRTMAAVLATIAFSAQAGIVTTVAPDGAGGVRFTIEGSGRTDGVCDTRICVTVPDRLFLMDLSANAFSIAIGEEPRNLLTPIDNGAGVMLTAVRWDNDGGDAPWTDDFDLNFSAANFFLPNADYQVFGTSIIAGLTQAEFLAYTVPGVFTSRGPDAAAWLGGWQLVLSHEGAVPELPPNPTPAPEPATFALLGLGLVGIAASRRRRLSYSPVDK